MRRSSLAKSSMPIVAASGVPDSAFAGAASAALLLFDDSSPGMAGVAGAEPAVSV
jgi:hypothetical protein